MTTVYYVDAMPGQNVRRTPEAALPSKVVDYDQDDDDSSTSTMSSDENVDDYDNDDDSEYSSESETMVNEIEERIEAYARVGSTPVLAQMVFDSHLFKLPSRKGKRSGPGSVKSMRSSPSVQQEAPEMFTAGELAKMLSAHRGPQRPGLKRSVSDMGLSAFAGYMNISSAGSVSSRSTVQKPKNNNTKPWDYLGSLLEYQGIKLASFPYNEIDEEFFSPLESHHFATYDNEIAQATRLGDLDTIRARHRKGKNLLACNRFRETTVHTICRRGHAHLLRYLLTKTDTPIQLVDDLGRNPLHDACWSHKPNFELIKQLVQKCPDLLYISDNRGFTPLSYVGKPCWGEWCKFLEENQDFLAPRELLVEPSDAVVF